MHIPPGFTRLFPYIFANDAQAYLNFLSIGLGGEIVSVYKTPDGIVANAHVRFGDTTIMVSDAREGLAASHGTHYLYVENADEAMTRAIAAGGRMVTAVGDRVYGDRQGGVEDPSGNIWWLSQRLAAGGY
jgi:PhnB protein